MPVSRRTLLEQEQWRDVIGAVGILQVSDLGRIKRIGRFGYKGERQRGPRSYLGRVSVPKPPKNNVWVGNRGAMDVAVLVLEAFVGPCPEGMECCHYDDDRSNNRLNNLRWDTHANNVRDGYRNGAKRSRITGEQTSMSKLNNEMVIRARQLREESPRLWTWDRLGLEFGVSRMTIKKAVERKTWRHIP